MVSVGKPWSLPALRLGQNISDLDFHHVGAARTLCATPDMQAETNMRTLPDKSREHVMQPRGMMREVAAANGRSSDGNAAFRKRMMREVSAGKGDPPVKTQLSVRGRACRRREGGRGETPLPSKLLLRNLCLLDAFLVTSSVAFQSGSSSPNELRLPAAGMGREAARRRMNILAVCARWPLLAWLPPPMASSPVGHSMPQADAARAPAAVLLGGRLAAVCSEARDTALVGGFADVLPTWSLAGVGPGWGERGAVPAKPKSGILPSVK